MSDAPSAGVVRAAAVQAEPVWLDADATTDKVVALIEEAARNDADLVAFPETFIPGYPWWIWLGSPAWGMQFVARYHANSPTRDGSHMSAIREAAAANEIHVVVGYSERAGGSLYMGQAIIDDTGDLVAARRKLKPTHVERTVFGEGDGSDLQVHDLELGKLGALCCWEHLQPLTKYAMYSMGEQIHVASWPSFSVYRGAAYALGPELNMAASQMYAAEGQVFVVAPCAIVGPTGLELFCDTPDKAQLLLEGGGFARIFGPDGSPLGEPIPEDQEGIVYADLDLSMISVAKSAADPVGHYSRPDVTRLLLNRTPTPPVEAMAGTMVDTSGMAEMAEPSPAVEAVHPES